ncbi:MAG: DUF2141 domain-containing protein [Planctomycetota bacterium]
MSSWKANHGSFLGIFAAVVFLAGCLVIFVGEMPGTVPSNDQSEANPGVPPPPSSPPDGSNSSRSNDLQEQDPAEAISIVIRGAHTDQGLARIAIYDSPETFNDPTKALYLLNTPLRGGRARVQLKPDRLPEKFAVAAYHDTDDDGSLSRNLLGIPTELYGFSNNARGLTGPPEFQQAAIDKPAPGGGLFVELQ